MASSAPKSEAARAARGSGSGPENQGTLNLLLCVRNFPSELEDRIGFALSRRTSKRSELPAGKKAACLEACINPAEGLHHWRCPNHPDRTGELQMWEGLENSGEGAKHLWERLESAGEEATQPTLQKVGTVKMPWHVPVRGILSPLRGSSDRPSRSSSDRPSRGSSDRPSRGSSDRLSRAATPGSAPTEKEAGGCTLDEQSYLARNTTLVARNAALEAKLAEANAVIRQLDPEGCAGYTEQLPEPCSPPIDSPSGPESLLQSARSPRAERGGESPNSVACDVIKAA
jgi:hypothetical protein